jgi:hypothetical protein
LIKVADACAISDTRVTADRSRFDQDFVDQRCLASRTVTTKRNVADVCDFHLRHADVPYSVVSSALVYM